MNDTKGKYDTVKKVAQILLWNLAGFFIATLLFHSQLDKAGYLPDEIESEFKDGKHQISQELFFGDHRIIGPLPEKMYCTDCQGSFAIGNIASHEGTSEEKSNRCENLQVVDTVPERGFTISELESDDATNNKVWVLLKGQEPFKVRYIPGRWFSRDWFFTIVYWILIIMFCGFGNLLVGELLELNWLGNIAGKILGRTKKNS